MRKILGTFALLFMVIFSGFSQEADKIVGTYLTEKKNAKVRISKQGDRYVGSIIWSITEGAKDKNNPKESERSKPIVGKVILKGFEYDGKDVWDEGTIYDPESGKTYSCKITRQKDGSLKVRGFIGISLVGRTSIWTRVE